jgi:NADH-quinone oxidoreductase subunit A
MIEILLFALSALVFTFFVNLTGKFIRVNHPNEVKNSVYECGEVSADTGVKSFHPRFYLIALFFVLFEAEIIFLFPWSALFSDIQLPADETAQRKLVIFFEVLVFIGIMIAGLAYIWKNGFLEWEKNKPPVIENDFPVSLSHYKEFNEKMNRQIKEHEEN